MSSMFAAIPIDGIQVDEEAIPNWLGFIVVPEQTAAAKKAETPEIKPIEGSLADIRDRGLALPLSEEAKDLWASMVNHINSALTGRATGESPDRYLTTYRVAMKEMNRLFDDRIPEMKKTACTDHAGQPSNTFNEMMALLHDMSSPIPETGEIPAWKNELAILKKLYIADEQKRKISDDVMSQKLQTISQKPFVAYEGKKPQKQKDSDTIVIHSEDTPSQFANHHWTVPGLETTHNKIRVYHGKDPYHKVENAKHRLRHTDLQIRHSAQDPSDENITDLHHSIYSLNQSFANLIKDTADPYERTMLKNTYQLVNRVLSAQMDAQNNKAFLPLKAEIDGSYDNPASFSIKEKPTTLRTVWNKIKSWVSAPNIRYAFNESHREKTLSEIMAEEKSTALKAPHHHIS
ncbi:MAG: hypothetical protein H6868_09440 [Rhodospirillales bacterium]|nr:hypothetical protein [Rhodospirillales bacterium]